MNQVTAIQIRLYVFLGFLILLGLGVVTGPVVLR